MKFSLCNILYFFKLHFFELITNLLNQPKLIVISSVNYIFYVILLAKAWSLPLYFKVLYFYVVDVNIFMILKFWILLDIIQVISLHLIENFLLFKSWKTFLLRNNFNNFIFDLFRTQRISLLFLIVYRNFTRQILCILSLRVIGANLSEVFKKILFLLLFLLKFFFDKRKLLR